MGGDPINFTDPTGLLPGFVCYAIHRENETEVRCRRVSLAFGFLTSGNPFGPGRPFSGGGSRGGGGAGATDKGEMGEEEDGVVCRGDARVLVGNKRTVGMPGGLSPDPRNGPPLIINNFSASIIPRQFTGVTDNVRPVLRQIAQKGQPIVGIAFDGPFAGQVLFNNIVDIIGGEGTTPTNAQEHLMSRFPNTFIVELPGAENRGFMDARFITKIEIRFPAGFPLGCPKGTSEVK